MPVIHKSFEQKMARVVACVLAACGFLLLPPSVHSADICLAGPTATWRDLVVITNSVRYATVLSELDHTIASTSGVDTCLSFLPDWGAWSNITDGTCDVWIETVGDGSNVVAVLLGDPETPALTVTRESDWSVLPVGTFPPDEPAVCQFGVTTNRIHITFRPSRVSGFGYALAETQTPGGSWTPRPDLLPADFGPLATPQFIPNWSKVGVWSAGPQAALTYLRLRWCIDGTVFIAR